MPIRATVNRQPNGVRPNIHCPAAIMILPSGGCATSSPALAVSSGRCSWLPATSRLLTLRNVVELYAVMQDRVGVRHVVGLVEDDGIGLAQPVEPQEAAEDRDEHRPGPAPEGAARAATAVAGGGPALASRARSAVSFAAPSGRRSS